MPAATCIDTHCHLDLPDYDADREQVLERARAAGVATVLVPSIDPEGMERVAALAARDARVQAAAGIHPHAAARLDDGVLARIRGLAAEGRIRAVGETGLDYYERYLERTPAPVQHRAFEAQLALACELGLPVIVHCREAFEDVLAMVRPWAGRLDGVFHCFSGTREEAAAVLELGFHLSFTGPLTFKKADELRAVAACVPLERTLLETDGPYLAPAPFRGKRNEPAWVLHTAAKLAEVHGRPLEDVARVTTEAARRLFKLELETGK